MGRHIVNNRKLEHGFRMNSARISPILHHKDNDVPTFKP